MLKGRQKKEKMENEYIEWYNKTKPSLITSKYIAKTFNVSVYKSKQIIKILVEEGLIRYGYYYSNYCSCLNEGQSYHDCVQYPPVCGYFDINSKGVNFK